MLSVLTAAAVQGAEDLIGVLLQWKQTSWLTLNTPYNGYVSDNHISKVMAKIKIKIAQIKGETNTANYTMLNGWLNLSGETICFQPLFRL